MNELINVEISEFYSLIKIFRQIISCGFHIEENPKFQFHDILAKIP